MSTQTSSVSEPSGSGPPLGPGIVPAITETVVRSSLITSTSLSDTGDYARSSGSLHGAWMDPAFSVCSPGSRHGAWVENNTRSRPAGSFRGTAPSSFGTPSGLEDLASQGRLHPCDPAHPGFSSHAFYPPMYPGQGYPAFMAPGPRPARHFPSDGFFHGQSFRPPYQYQPYPLPYGVADMQGSEYTGQVLNHDSAPPPPASTGSDSEDIHSVAAEPDSEREIEDASFSFNDAVGRLASVCPELVGSAPETTASRSAAERFLGLKPSKAPSARLLESEMVSKAVEEAQAKARGGVDPPIQGSVPNLPTAMAQGFFIKSPKVPVKRSCVIGSSWPQAPSQASQEDLLLLGEGKQSERTGSRSVTVKDAVLKDWELLAISGLTAVSAMDSFFGGLVSSVSELDEKDNFVLREDIVAENVSSFAQATAKSMNFLAEAFATLHMNVTLCRRDAILSQSDVLKKSASTKNSLRAVPLGSPALFGGGHIPPTIHGLAESRRDLAFVLPRQASRSSSVAQGRNSQGRKSSSSSGRSSYSRNRGGRAASNSGARNQRGKPYDRRQASKADSKPSPQ